MACVDDPGAAALAQRSAALGVRVLRYGSGAGEAGSELAGALVGWEQHRTGAVATIQLAGRRIRAPCDWRCRAGTWR